MVLSRASWLSLSLILSIISHNQVRAFSVPPQQLRPQQQGRRTLLYSSNRSDGKLNRNTRKDPEETTLYDLLGASQSDSQENLKIRYRALAKNLHPDARLDNLSSISGYADLSEINAAWEILSNPKERLRYDRELNAKAFTEGFEAVFSLGIQTAIPFLRKTAKSTAEAVETSSKAVNEGAEEFQKNFGIFELEQSSRSLEQRAALEGTKATRLKTQLVNISSRRLKTLEPKNIAKITSAEALRILKTFDIKKYPNVDSDVTAFSAEERRFQEGNRKRVETERTRKTAERLAEQAVRAEEMALKKVQEAQQALELATENNFDAQERRDFALKQEQAAEAELKKIKSKMELSREKVRVGLVKKEDTFLDKEAKDLKEEIKSAEVLAKQLKVQANKLKAQSEYKKLQDQ